MIILLFAKLKKPDNENCNILHKFLSENSTPAG